MAVKIGKVVKVTCGTSAANGTYVVSEMGQYSLSGFSRDALDSTAFGDDVKEFTFGVADAGEITFSGNYDPADTTGQEFINSYCSNGSVFTTGMLRLYVDSTSYLTIGGGNILITKTKAIAFDKAGLGTISFTGKLSGSAMVVV